MSKENEEEEMISSHQTLDEFIKEHTKLKDDKIIKEEMETEFQYFFLESVILEQKFEELD
jgi:hypothetical protein